MAWADVEQELARVPPGLAALGRGFGAWFAKPRDLDAAERHLRRAAEVAPLGALAWNALGAVAKARGQFGEAAGFIEDALRRCPGMELARRNLDDLKLRTEVFVRLRERLRSLPARWATLPLPAISVSGRSVETVLEEAPKEALEGALKIISALAQAPLAERPLLIERLRQTRPPTEVDLWFPLELANSEQVRSVEEAALTAEAWLQWAEVLGRRDAVRRAVGVALALLRLRLPPQDLIPLGEGVLAIAGTPQDAFGLATVAQQMGSLYFLGGQNEKALAAYRTARKLFVEVGTKQGQANTLDGEAAVLFHLNQNEGALAAYRAARKLFVEVGDKLGQANTLQGEAAVLLLLGQNEGALAAYRAARKLYGEVGTKQGQANTLDAEAAVLLRLGQNEGALAAYRAARKLFVEVGTKQGQANTLRGEAKILFVLGQNERALAAYRAARKLYGEVGDKLGQANTLRGEAKILFVLGQNEGALAAYRTARKLYGEMGDKLGQANTLDGEAAVLSLLDQNEGALAAYRAARKLFVEVGTKQGQANTLNGEAAVLFVLGQNEGALAAYRAARKLFVADGDEVGQGSSLLGEARMEQTLKQHAACAEHAEAAVVLAEKQAARPNARLAHMMAARCLFQVGQLEPSLDHARQAARLLREWQRQALSDRQRTIMGNDSDPYDILVPVLALQGQLGAALAYAEEAHAPVLRDLLQAPRRALAYAHR